MPQPTGPEYGASKAAINNLSLSLTKALGASGVTVNTVSPGMILTPKLEEVLEATIARAVISSRVFSEKLRMMIPPNRFSWVYFFWSRISSGSGSAVR
jgi:NAD(P)-dependent dehydrogenase (short-subunit alcohol dehydrogenase family)